MRQYSDQKLGSRWIGRGGPISRPPQPPNLTPCDFFLRVHIKDGVFGNVCFKILELNTTIKAAISSITEKTLYKIVENTDFRMRVHLRQNGAYFENHL